MNDEVLYFENIVDYFDHFMNDQMVEQIVTFSNTKIKINEREKAKEKSIFLG